jgi:hypothetical protein
MKPLETQVAVEKTLFLKRFKSVSFDTPCDVCKQPLQNKQFII